jgi:hypothetical protein
MDETFIAFGRPLGSARQLSDEEFLQAVAWSPGAQPSLVKFARQGDVAAFCEQLKKHRLPFGNRSRAKKAQPQHACQKHSLWSRHALEASPRTAELVEIYESLGRKTKRLKAKMGVKQNSSKRKTNGRANRLATADQTDSRISHWLSQVAMERTLTPFELLVLFEMLMTAGDAMTTDVCWRLWRTAFTAAVELRPAESGKQKAESRRQKTEDRSQDAEAGGENSALTDAATADRSLLIHGELPWAASLLFADVKGSTQVGNRGRKFLCRALVERTDTDGTPSAQLLERLSLWLAPFVRASEWAKRFKTGLWDEQSGRRFRAMVKVLAPLCRADGRMTGGVGNVVGLLTSASRLAGWKKKSLPSQLLLALGNGSAALKRAKLSNGKKPTSQKMLPATQSDWARLACLRNNWSIEADTLVVAHHGEKPIIDLTMLGRPLLSGVWDIEVCVDGNSVRFEDEWKCVCWYSDEDADFLELQALPGKRLQIDRQLLLSRNNHFVLLADAITGPRGARIEYTARLPLVEGLMAEHDLPTRECVLKAPRQSARVFPMALPSERVIGTSGAFRSEEGRLELRQVGIGGLYAPLVIDWAPERRRSYADWRTLTVTQQGRTIKSNAAAGHRLRIGNHQLFFYRSLIKSEETRAVLGHHTSNETVVGKLSASGDVEPILIVE